MEVLFHFIFELLKIAVLGSVYSTLVLFTFKTIGHYKPDSWFDRVSRRKWKLWFLSGLVISVGLFLFMFTYFGDHGLGDTAIVPVGHYQVIREVNGNEAYIENGKGDQLGINNFTFDSEHLYAETGRKCNGETGEYVVWNLKTDNWTFYKTKNDYIELARQNNYPPPEIFEDFWKFYRRHWCGWRFWLLP